MMDPDKIRRMSSELCNTNFNDHVTIIISGVQYNQLVVGNTKKEKGFWLAVERNG